MSMKLILLALICACAVSAENIPSGAVKVDENTSKYTDAAGKKWIYRTTPFGTVKYEDKAAAPDGPSQKKDQAKDKTPFGRYDSTVSAQESSIRMTKAREEKGTIYFERPGPFGMIRWSRAKNELTDEEKAIWESRTKPAGSQEPRN
jgi:hypothetical protein